MASIIIILKTSMYNHSEIGDGKLPLIPNVVYKSLIWLLENKFEEESEYLLSKYTLTEYQTQLYESTKKQLTLI